MTARDSKGRFVRPTPQPEPESPSAPDGDSSGATLLGESPLTASYNPLVDPLPPISATAPEPDEVVALTRDATRKILAQNDRAIRLRSRLLTLMAVLVITLLAAFGTLTIIDQGRIDRRLLAANSAREAQSTRILQILNDVTQTINPASSLAKRNATNLQAIVVRVEQCLYRHEDRLVAAATHQPVPPPLAGCPKDAP